MEIEQSVWGFSPEGEVIVKYRMTNTNGAYIELCNFGATILSVVVPDSECQLADVALGYGRWQDYVDDGPYMGKIVGRVGNRISGASFELDGKRYRLPANGGADSLHGGGSGSFSNKIWESSVEGDVVVFTLLSPDADQGYPGNLKVEVCYEWNDNCDLKIAMRAMTDAPTLVSLTNHTYFNLAGESNGLILDHELQLNCANFLPVERNQIPTGEIVAVDGTPMDFRSPKKIGNRIDDTSYDQIEIGAGYDNCWTIDHWQEGKLALVGSLYEPLSGRKMEILTTLPGVQIYTGNWLSSSPVGKSGKDYDNRSGVAIECQGFPDSANIPEFPSVRLDPGQLYDETIIYRFTTA